MNKRIYAIKESGRGWYVVSRSTWYRKKKDVCAYDNFVFKGRYDRDLGIYDAYLLCQYEDIDSFFQW